MSAAEEPDISETERKTLIERADAVLDRLAKIPSNAEAVLVAELLLRREAHR